ncbi:hypothetical protein L950_0223345 [Sphingobacterium sp. IITKGP-BTPF85]|nr:hypothetical protein L950_0223345 [Sphingobacterium sp. IITKGP-BTPF85]
MYGAQDKYGLLRADGSVFINATYEMVSFRKWADPIHEK